MAIYPCQIGMHRYPQPQQAAYFSRIEGREVSTRRARLCPSHFREVVAYALERFENVTDDGQSSMLCSVCGSRRDTTLFLRLFPAKSEEAVFAIDVCSAHAQDVGDKLLVASWEPLSRG